MKSLRRFTRKPLTDPRHPMLPAVTNTDYYYYR